MSVNPRNPTIPKGAETPVKGQTRPTASGGIEMFDTSTQAWRPAIQHHLIRSRLLRQAKRQEGAYLHPRGHGTGNNETAPLREDLNYGSDWANRPALLFQLRPAKNHRCVEPTGVMMYHGRVVLDPFDHPVRDFGRELPATLSTEMKGDEVEYYLRKNLAIKVYDLIARMSNGYTIVNKTYPGPPRILAVRERATKFREKAGCLAWNKRDGSKPINDYIMGLLPAGATTTRSLGGNLTPQQIVLRKAGNKGRYNNRRRKSKREAEAVEEEEEEDVKMEDSSEGRLNGAGDSDEDGQGEGYQPPPQTHGRKRRISETSSDASPEVVDENPKRRRLDVTDKIVFDDVRDVNILSTKRSRRKPQSPPSSTNLNQSAAAKASGRVVRATKKAGGRSRKAAAAPRKQDSESESEYEEPRVEQSSGGEHGSSPKTGANPSTGMSGNSSPENADSGAGSGNVGTNTTNSSPKTGEKSPTETPELDPDMRFRVPSTKAEINRLRRAVQITLADFADRIGHGVENIDTLYDLTIHEDESYFHQHQHLTRRFSDFDKYGRLYMLGEWTGGFGNWQIEEEDERGPLLLAMMRGEA